MEAIRPMDIRGLNVTMPHKETVVKYLNEIKGNLGTVNTVLNIKGNLIGYSTDGEGAIEALRFNNIDPRDKKILILGAGGASRAVAHSLVNYSREIVILNRTVNRAEKLALEVYKSTKKMPKAKHFSELNLKTEISEADILINATSIGMHPNEQTSPIKKKYLNSNIAVFDLIYSPIETKLLKDAKSMGAVTVDGLSMLVHQGAASFEIWTGKKAPTEIMMKAALHEISRRGSKRS
jgi:shikimate dehydrogenase